MSEINSINPTPMPALPQPPAAVEPPAPTPPTSPPPQQAQAEHSNRFEFPNYTVRYQVDGKDISIHILDSDGRLVRTVPPRDLLKALQSDMSKPHVNLHG